MRLTAVLALACLLALAFAGCSGKDKDGGTSSSSTSSSHSSSSATTTSASSSSTSHSSSSTSTGPQPNRAPTGSISALVNGTLATFTLNGTDPDGDALTWHLAFGDGNSTNGTSVPATLDHNYTAPSGNLTVHYTLTDGKSPVTYNVTLNMTGGGAPAFVFTGAVAQSCAGPCELGTPVGSPPIPLPGAGGCVDFYADKAGTFCIWTELPAGLVGKAFTLTSTSGDPDAEFFDSCDAAMGASVGTFYNAGQEAGAVPAGAGCAIVWEANDGPSTLTLTVG
jgi:hypothetical protein